MNPSKEELRRKLLEKRAALENREEKDRLICQAVLSFPPYRQAGQLLFYVSTPREADTRRLLELALAEGREVYVPASLPEGALAFRRILSQEDLRPGRFGILEPSPSCPAWSAEAGKKALCLVPGTAFDRRGYRIGYGKGYYDRFLAAREIPSLGLCYWELLLEALPAEGHDQRVSFLATENGCAACTEKACGKEDRYE